MEYLIKKYQWDMENKISEAINLFKDEVFKKYFYLY
jgi:hypothetical protein